MAYRVATRAVSPYGFAKSERENISAEGEQTMAETGAQLLRIAAKGIDAMIEDDELRKITP